MSFGFTLAYFHLLVLGFCFNWCFFSQLHMYEDNVNKLVKVQKLKKRTS